MVSILPHEPLEMAPDIFEKLKTEGATIEWIEPEDGRSFLYLRYYRINGFVCVLKQPTAVENDG